MACNFRNARLTETEIFLCCIKVFLPFQYGADGLRIKKHNGFFANADAYTRQDNFSGVFMTTLLYAGSHAQPCSTSQQFRGAFPELSEDGVLTKVVESLADSELQGEVWVQVMSVDAAEPQAKSLSAAEYLLFAGASLVDPRLKFASCKQTHPRFGAIGLVPVTYVDDDRPEGEPGLRWGPNRYATLDPERTLM